MSGEKIIEIVPYILSVLSLASMVSASLIKGQNMKKILVLVFCGNTLAALSYLASGGGLNGAASCFIGSAQTVINYFFESKGKPLPKWLVIIYMLAFVSVNLAVGMSGDFDPLCILAIVASLTFVMCIGQKSGAKYRFWTIVNMLLWCTYDVLTKTWSNLVTHVCLLAFTVVGMIIHDRKSGKNKA